MTAPELAPPATTLPALPAAAQAPAPDKHPAAVYLASLSEGPGRESMRATLAHVAAMLGTASIRDCPWQDLGYQHVAALRSILAERFAPATVNKYLSAVRQVMKNAWLLGLTDAETYHRAAAVPNVKGSRLPAGRALDAREIERLFQACSDGTPAGARDGAAFALMFGMGMRRSEAAGTGLDDYDPESGALRIIGKGNRQRLVFATNGGKALIADWLAVRGDAPGPLLSPVSKSGAVDAGTGITPQALMYRLRKRCDQAGVKRASPHDLRRTFVSSALAAGADLARVQRLAGHRNPATTERYDRRPEDALREAAALVHVPYFGAAH